MKKICLQCNSEFISIRYSQKFCSVSCSAAHSSRVRYGPKLYKNCIVCNNSFLARKAEHRVGHAKFCSMYCRDLGFKSENNPSWQGDNVSYRSLHKWVQDNYGKPSKCEHCEKDGLSSYFIQWANKSKTYRRDRTDWLRLCIWCHKKFDSKKRKLELTV